MGDKVSWALSSCRLQIHDKEGGIRRNSTRLAASAKNFMFYRSIGLLWLGLAIETPQIRYQHPKAQASN